MNHSDPTLLLTPEFRTGVYAFLSAVSNAAPRPPHLALFQPSEIREVLAVISPEAETLLQHEHELKSVKQDYNDLFAVPGPKYVAPYESVYRDTTRLDGSPSLGLLMGPSTIQVKKIYAHAGFELSPHCPELPDYLGIEMEFMAVLSTEEQFSPHLKPIQLDFLQNHLARWIEPVSARIQQNAETLFYQGVALLARHFILGDLERLRGQHRDSAQVEGLAQANLHPGASK